MGYSLKIFLVDEDDNIKKIPLSRFEKIRNRDPGEALEEYKNSRIRYAEVVVELKNRKPASIARIVYGYLKFDTNGLTDEEYLNKEMQAALCMLPTLSFDNDSEKVINSANQFAQKRFKNEFTWTPSQPLKNAIIEKVFE